MAILSEILGSSFGRNPSVINAGGVRMPMLPQVQMYPAPQRQTDTRTPYAGGTQPAESPTQAFGDFQNNLNSILHPSAAASPANPAVTAAPNVPAAASAAATPAAGNGGIMGSIMQAFNGGAGGGMDLSKLISMLPAIIGG
jgi:hypothetical protein